MTLALKKGQYVKVMRLFQEVDDVGPVILSLKNPFKYLTPVLHFWKILLTSIKGVVLRGKDRSRGQLRKHCSGLWVV